MKTPQPESLPGLRVAQGSRETLPHCPGCPPWGGQREFPERQSEVSIVSLLWAFLATSLCPTEKRTTPPRDPAPKKASSSSLPSFALPTLSSMAAILCQLYGFLYRGYLVKIITPCQVMGRNLCQGCPYCPFSPIASLHREPVRAN